MIAGIIGMLAAVVIFILIALFSAKQPNPTIAVPLGNFLASQGFARLDPSSAPFKAISNILSSTADDTFISQIYQNKADNILICWCSSSDGGNNSILSAIPGHCGMTPWILLSLPVIGGVSAPWIRKAFEALGRKSKRSSFSKLESNPFGESIDFYLPVGGKIPDFPKEFIGAFPQFGNILLRSMGGMILIERLSASRGDSWDEEARSILNLTKRIKLQLGT